MNDLHTYRAEKKYWGETVLFQRFGRDYTTFDSDARLVAATGLVALSPIPGVDCAVVPGSGLKRVLDALISKGNRVAVPTPDGTEVFPVAHDPSAPVTHLTHTGMWAGTTLCGEGKTDTCLYQHAVYAALYAIPNLCPACKALLLE